MDNICLDYRTDLSAFVDGQLEPKVLADFQIHLDGCEPCSSELQTLKSLNQFLAENMKVDSMPEIELWNALEALLPPVCELVKDDLSAFIDHELTQAATEGVSRHTKECLPCMSAYKELNDTSRSIAKALELSDSIKIDLWPAVKARLNEDCVLIQGELSSYSDQEVPTLRHRSITKHLLDCGECRNHFDKISFVGDVIRDVYRPTIPDNFDLWPDVKRKLQVVPFTPKVEMGKVGMKAKIASPRMFWASSAAAVLAIVGSAALWLGAPKAHAVELVSSEAYLIEAAMTEPAEMAEAVVYDEQ